MVELKGSLGSLGLPAIVQLIGELHHSGNLELSKDDARAVLGFDDGRLVAARCGDERGLNALAACTVELANADFVFVDGTLADEPTLNLGGSELQKQLRQLMNGEATAEGLESTPAKPDEPALGICPRLGFVDDPTRHYSRPTAMHRCFASSAPSLVTTQDQRALCLSGRYPTCPRYRNASDSTSTSPTLAPAPIPHPLGQRSPVPPPVSPPMPVNVPPGMPHGVAARLAASTQMRLATPDAVNGVGDRIVDNHSQPPVDSLPTEPGPSRFGLRRPRGWWLLAVGAGLGLLVLVVGVFLARPSDGLNPQPAAVATPTELGATALRSTAPVPSTTTSSGAVPSAVADATNAAPQVAASPSAASRVLAPVPSPQAAAPSPQAAVAIPPPAPGQPLIDVRFASGPKPGWLDNPPYATWSDGAYRLQARQRTHFVAISVPIDHPLGDVVASATFRKTGGPPGGGYGLVVRDQGPDSLNGVNQTGSFYVMETGDLGDIGIWRRDGDHWVDLVPWEHSDSVRVGGSPNDLVARAVGDRLTFMVNQTEVASVQDNTLAAGGVGLFVGGDNNEVALDRFVVQVPN